MTGIVADVNFIGQLRVIGRILEHSDVAEFWAELHLPIMPFEVLGLPPEAADRLVWNRCQELKLLLITGNRNNDGPDSLQATIDDSNTPNSLPVITLGNANRVIYSASFAVRVARDLLEYLLDLRDARQLLLGTGRLYLPRRTP